MINGLDDTLDLGALLGRRVPRLLGGARAHVHVLVDELLAAPTQTQGRLAALPREHHALLLGVGISAVVLLRLAEHVQVLGVEGGSHRGALALYVLTSLIL